ncbi:decorin isoform 2-T2 [Rhynchocyon petersi]
MRYIMKATIIFLLLAQASWAGPFQQRGLFDFMLEDEGSALDPDEEYLPFGCPFRCQCHLRVVQCSDLGLEKVPKSFPHDTTLLDLQNNKITEIKDGDFKDLKKLHIVYLHNNNISEIGADDFCVHGYNGRKASYTSLSLYGNPVQYWEILPSTFRCVYVPGAIQLGNFK